MSSTNTHALHICIHCTHGPDSCTIMSEQKNKDYKLIHNNIIHGISGREKMNDTVAEILIKNLKNGTIKEKPSAIKRNFPSKYLTFKYEVKI